LKEEAEEEYILEENISMLKNLRIGANKKKTIGIG